MNTEETQNIGKELADATNDLVQSLSKEVFKNQNESMRYLYLYHLKLQEFWVHLAGMFQVQDQVHIKIEEYLNHHREQLQDQKERIAALEYLVLKMHDKKETRTK